MAPLLQRSDGPGGEPRFALLHTVRAFAADRVRAPGELVQRHPDHAGQIGILLTSDEEGIAVDGIKRVAEVLRERLESRGEDSEASMSRRLS